MHGLLYLFIILAASHILLQAYKTFCRVVLSYLDRFFSLFLERKRKKKKVKSLSRVWLFANPWTVACQDSPSLGFSRQEHWSGLPFPSTADLPNSVIEPSLLHCRQMLYHLSHQGRSSVHIYFLICSPGNIFFLIFKMKKTENKASQ